MLRRAELALALLVGLAAAPGAAAALEALSPEDEFVKGVFSPNFVPPVPGATSFRRSSVWWASC